MSEGWLKAVKKMSSPRKGVQRREENWGWAVEAEPTRDPGEEVRILNNYGHTSLGDKVSGAG